MKFTDRYIKSLEAKSTRYEVIEGGGFGVRVSPSGVKTFFYVFQFEGKNQRLTLGGYPEISLAKAREAYGAAFKKVKVDGINPVEAVKAQKLEQEQKQEEYRLADTVASLAHEYMEKWSKPRKRSWAEDQRILDLDVLPKWGTRKAKEITRRDVIALLDRIVDRGAPIAANRTFEVVRRMFNFAMERGIIEVTPCLAVRAPSQENRRDRVLTETEIRTFWMGLENAGMDPGTKLALRLMLMTAQRAGEIIGAAWADMDLESGWWTIPAAKVKNKLPHRVPLSGEAMGLLDEIKTLAGDSQWLFPSPRGRSHIAESALGHAVRKNLTHFDIPQFTPHDLRRTAASHMTGSGISRLVVSKILNHAEPGVTAIYDRHSYDREKQTALNAWAVRLVEIVHGQEEGKVVPFARGGTSG